MSTVTRSPSLLTPSLSLVQESVQATEDLNNMQCMWYLTEMARAYQRLGQWGEALKKCLEVDRVSSHCWFMSRGNAEALLLSTVNVSAFHGFLSRQNYNFFG